MKVIYTLRKYLNLKIEILCLGIQIVQLGERFESSIGDYIVRGVISFKAFDDVINNK